MPRNLRQNVLILTVVLSFFALSLATSAESAQTSRKPKAAPTPAKKTVQPTSTPSKKTTAKATPTPNKKTQAKAAPTPKKSPATTAKSKTSDKKTIAKSSVKDTSKDKAAAKTKQTPTKQTASTKSNQKAADKKVADKKTAASKSTKTDSKTAAKSSKPVTIAKTASAKPSVTKKTTTKTLAKTPVQPIENSPAEAPKIIVTDIAARIRSQAKPSAPELGHAKLGTILQVSEKTPAWYRVQFASGAKTSSGWISANSVNDLNSAAKDQIYRQITDRYYKDGGMNFATASQLYEFLTRASSESGNSDSAELGLKRLLALRSALKAVPSGRAGESPYRDFLKAHEKQVVFSEPSGEWLVNSSLFWDLHKKHGKSPVADQIAWEGAQNPLPGECEGYVNCHLFFARMTSGEYLSLHPNGKKNLAALTDLTNMLEPIAASLTEKTVYTGPTDVTDRAEFNNLIAEIRTIISRLPLTEKEKPLQQLKKIAEGFR